MNTDLKHLVWIAFKIWLLAILFNTTMGTAFLTGFFNYTDEIELLIIYGTLLGAMYSFPVFVILCIIIYRCVKKQRTGSRIFKTVLLSGIMLSMLPFLVFNNVWGGGSFWTHEGSMLLSIAVISGIGGMATQFKPLVKLGAAYKPENL